MTEAELAAAIKLVNRVCSRDYHPGETPPLPAPASVPVGEALHGAGWPPGSLDVERSFGAPHARLYPFLGRKVRTPEGPGTLLQVFSDRCAVLLAPEAEKCRFFAPDEIEPVSWES